MRNKLFLIISVIMIMTIVGCASSTVNNSGDTQTSSNDLEVGTAVVADKDPLDTEDANEQSIEVDKGFLNVEITLPASLFEGDDIDEVIASAKEDGVKEVTVNDNGSLTYKMSKSAHNEVLKEMEAGILEYIEEIKGDEEYESINDITYNKSFSEFTMIVDQEKYENSFLDGFAAFGLGMTGIYYRLFDGADPENYKVTIFIKDETSKEIFDTIVYPDALEDI